MIPPRPLNKHNTCRSLGRLAPCVEPRSNWQLALWGRVGASVRSQQLMGPVCKLVIGCIDTQSVAVALACKDWLGRLSQFAAHDVTKNLRPASLAQQRQPWHALSPQFIQTPRYGPQALSNQTSKANKIAIGSMDEYGGYVAEILVTPPRSESRSQ